MGWNNFVQTAINPWEHFGNGCTKDSNDSDPSERWNPKPITIHQLAVHRGLKTQPDRSYSGADIGAVGLALLGGCAGCGATIAAYNAHPSKSGVWLCGDCVGDHGYATVEAANSAIFGEPEPTDADYRAELATVLAALRYYQQEGLGDPDNRPSDIHTNTATDDDCCISLDAEAVDTLCERINCGEWPAKQPSAILQPLNSPPEGQDYWNDEDADYPVDQWVEEVSQGDTRSGYWEWAQNARESNSDTEGQPSVHPDDKAVQQ